MLQKNEELHTRICNKNMPNATHHRIAILYCKVLSAHELREYEEKDIIFEGKMSKKEILMYLYPYKEGTNSPSTRY